MADMVERVMRAIAAAEGYDVDGLTAYASSSSVAKADVQRLRRKSVAAIKAMREFVSPEWLPTIDATLAAPSSTEIP